MKKLFSVVSAVVMTLAGLAPVFAVPVAHAATVWNVSVGSPGACNLGDPNCATIQAAVTAAFSGDTINVAAGTYNESPDINKSVTLQSIGGRNVTTIVLQTGPTYTGSLTIEASDVTVSGFTIQGFDASGSGLASTNIYLTSGVSNVTVSNNKIEVGQIGTGANGDDGIGLLTTYTTSSIGDNINVTGNIFQTVDSAGGFRAFYINAGVNHFTFSGNTITGNFTKGSFTQAESGLVQDNTVTGVGSTGSRSAGLGTWGYPDPTVWGHTTFSGNTISGTSKAITVYEANNVTINGNTLSGNGTGVWVGDATPLAFDVTTIAVHNNDVSNQDTSESYGYGVQNESASTGAVNASCNWWGAINGPGPVGSGSGSLVTTNVTASTWLTSSNLTSDCNGPLPTVVPSATTNAAAGMTTSDATLNGANGPVAATGHSFWVSLAPFVTTSPTIPSGVYSTPVLGPVAANTAFSASLSSITTTGVPTNLPLITPGTQYYFAAWSEVGGTWYPGAVLSFSTSPAVPTIPVYSGNNSCSSGKTPVLLNNLTQTIDSQTPTPVTVTLPAVGEYLFEATGDYGYGGDPANNTVNRADAGYATGDNWANTLDSILGIAPGTTYRGVTSLLSDMGTGTMGIVNWGSYNANHDYNFNYTPTNTTVQFVISDWYDSWYAGGVNNNQGGMGDNSGSLTLKVYSCNTVTLPAPTLLSPVNGTITTTAGFVSTNWNSVTDSVGGITYIYQSSNSSAQNSDGSFVSPAYTSGALTATTIPTPGTPAGVYYWHVQAKDSAGNVSPWSDIWMFTVDNTPPAPQATCPAGTSPTLVETDSVDSASSEPISSTYSLLKNQTYLLVSSGTWKNSSLNAADTAYASVDNWVTHMQGYNITPYFLGTGEFQLQVDSAFVNWGSYSSAHTYSSLYTGTGAPVNLGVFDGDSTQVPPVANPGWYGDNSGSLAVSIYSCDPTTGSLTINKIANGGNGTFNFTSDIPGGSSFSIITTNGTGDSQTFANLTPGTYHVTEVNMPKGWTQTDNDCSAVTVTAGGDVTCTIMNTNNKLLGAIVGTKYEDRDGDGTLKDGDHHRLSGWTIYLDTNNNSVLDSGEPSTVTDSHGNYRFVGLVAGTYHVREVGQPGWIQTVPSSGKYDITLAAGKISKKNNFGNFKLGSISGMKYGDLNGNGKKDNGEGGLAGWTIKLKGPGSSGPTVQTTTDASGNYSFTGLKAGTYTLSEVIPPATPAWHQTQHPGSIKIQSGTNAAKENFGNTQRPANKFGGYFDFGNNYRNNGFR